MMIILKKQKNKKIVFVQLVLNKLKLLNSIQIRFSFFHSFPLKFDLYLEIQKNILKCLQLQH